MTDKLISTRKNDPLKNISNQKLDCFVVLLYKHYYLSHN